MNTADILKEIRSTCHLSQNELAQRLGVSFATVNRWEKGHNEPSKIAMNAIKNFCDKNNIDFEKFLKDQRFYRDEIVTLYHGSKSGLMGDISPSSRSRCDFGQGFYMGDEIFQPLTLICNFPHPILYTVSLDLRGLEILDLELGLDWALLVAYNRGKMENNKGSNLYQRISSLFKDCDIIIGYIANDRMFAVLDQFFNNLITDEALIHSLSALKLGKQYVAMTPKACSQISVIEKHNLSQDERETLKIKSEENRLKGITLANDICRQYRRQGRFFDEILEDGK